MNAPAGYSRLPPIFPDAWACAWGQDGHGLWQQFEVGAVVQRLRWVPPGELLMGSPEDELEREPFGLDETQHQVILSRGFWLPDTACTQALWWAALDEEPSHFKGPERPVEQVSWDDISDRFLPALNRLVPGLDARLPTEAEWEYACRAGTRTPFSFGEQITTKQVNYDGNYPYGNGAKGEYRQQTVEVKALPANDWGLYQMHGNVQELCADWHGDYPAGPVVDPLGSLEGRGRVLRGGDWDGFARWCRSAYRNALEPGYRYHRIGFRLARGPSPGSGQAGQAGGEGEAGVAAGGGAPAAAHAAPAPGQKGRDIDG